MITLIPYSPTWMIQFEVEKNMLLKALGNIATHIEHIGSTAIPGIYAKPVIDILIGVSDLNKITEYHIRKIEALGYQYNPIFEEQLPNRRYFFKNDVSGIRTHQIHLVNYPSSWWNKHILFRNYLRCHPDIAKEYEQHKLILAKKFDDTLLYANAKTDFCKQIDKLAYFDFKINQPDAETNRLFGYIPQPICFETYKNMFQDDDFSLCFGIKLNDEHIQKILTRDTVYWDQYRFGPFVWFEKETQKFVGEGGLNHTIVENIPEIELTYSLRKEQWGKGFAVEIGQYAIQQAFEIINLDNIVCFTTTTNIQSLRVMEKLRFKYEKDFIRANLPHKLYRLTP